MLDLHEVKILTPKLGEGIHVYEDEYAQTWLKFDPLTPHEKAHGPFALPCYRYCKFHMARPHVTCFTCRIRQISQGKIGSLMRVDLYVVALSREGRFLKVRDWIVKRLLTLAEFFSCLTI